MAQEAEERDSEKRPDPRSTPVVVAAPPANMDGRHRPLAAGEDNDDVEPERKIPKYAWVSLQVLVTAVVCSPLLAFALTRTDWLGKLLFAVVVLPVAAGLFFLLHTVCKRPPACDDGEVEA